MSAPACARLWSRVCALGLSLALVSCGGAITAGIEGTGMQVAAVSSGAISRFGSIFVNGVEFNTTAALVYVNGQSAAASTLRVGQVVKVQGTVAGGGTTGAAARVDYRANVQGPIATVNATAYSFTVLGQTVTVGPQTSLAADAGGSPGFAALQPGALVEVSGYANANGTIAATRIDLKSRVGAYLITGTVGTVDGVAYLLTVNGATVDFSSAALAGFPAGGSVRPGDQIEVTSTPGAAAGTLAASAIELVSRVTAGNGDYGRIDGEITRFASAADFDVADTTVTTNPQTVFQNGAIGQLAANVHVTVQGSYDAGGTLVAATVRFDESAPILLKAPVDAVDAAANTLTILGMTVTTDAETRFDDESANPVSPFNLTSIAPGDYLEIHGRATGGNAVAATVVTREAPGAGVELRGTATAVAAPNLTVLGINALTGAATQYFDANEAPITSAQFFAAAPGAVVDLSGSYAGGALGVAAAALSNPAELGD